MASYGRNFDFRVPPVHGQRGGRFVLDPDSSNTGGVPIGAPVLANGDGTDANGLLTVDLATGAQAPVKGQSGILVYEAFNLAGLDPYLSTYSDVDKAPLGQAIQVVSGDHVKVAFRNTADRTFYNSRAYLGRAMVAPANLSGLAVGDMLTPGTGNDTAGYWAKTVTAADAWLLIEAVDAARGEVEARFVF